MWKKDPFPHGHPFVAVGTLVSLISVRACVCEKMANIGKFLKYNCKLYTIIYLLIRTLDKARKGAQVGQRSLDVHCLLG